ncbi:MAG: SRPBCC domain-containing protein [Phycisphaerae bacterium]|nr:SRPBCC domain-containing protein [Phycisphaerae bacterium]
MIPATSSDTRLVIERVLRADREAVFRCWTDPAHLMRWFGPAEHSTPLAEVDLRVGGRYRIGMKKGADGPTHIVGGVYREISPPERLVFTWAWETSVQPADETLVTVDLHDMGDQTRLVLTQEKFPSGAMREQHFEGWSSCLDRLVRLVGEGR